MEKITYRLRRQRRKTLVLKIENGEVVVYAPLKFPTEKVDAFVVSKVDWIRGKLENFENTKGIIDEINNLNKVLLFGNEYNIELSDLKKTIELTENKLLVPKKYSDEKKKMNAVVKYLKNYAIEFLQERLNYYSNLHSINYGELTLTNAKKKWGSCDWRKDIKLNFRLILLPIDIIDYVILHELSHTC